jgi:hypothetical protein
VEWKEGWKEMSGTEGGRRGEWDSRWENSRVGQWGEKREWDSRCRRIAEWGSRGGEKYSGTGGDLDGGEGERWRVGQVG